ncbi:sister chromatid cohesion protein DCC1 [Notechis scutatus]|uniref:Sister chromatid cohesion protein DCC1 n=1 Tax=Notechis scutatus TaxID=8663 RepID=A0A6J1VNH4_9SAUR|nr:sister chromatid cohesion protein DCC1 [Notechis scutatus]
MPMDSEESKPPRMRSREEVDATLQVAKLNPAELLPTVQCLSFSPQIDAGDYCLLQLEPELCHELEAGRSLVIRGEKNEHAVICSKDKTYDMKIADTSNMLLFIPSGETPEQLRADKATTNILHPEIAGFSNHFWELRRCRPKLKKLKRFLLENPYEGPDSEKERIDANSKYTTEDFLDLVQASEEEIMHQLKILKACQVQGYWRILDFDYEMKLLNHVAQLIYSESWLFSKVPLSLCVQELEPLEPKEMIEHILESYGEKYMDEGEAYFEMNEEKVCRAIAQMLLQNAVKFNLSEFQEVWQQSVPEGMTTRLDQLKGLALVDRSSKPEIIFLLNVEDLPEDDNERFKHLFSIREKWTEADITPYIENLCSEKQKIGTLLTKYARSSMQNGLKVYNSRRPVS